MKNVIIAGALALFTSMAFQPAAQAQTPVAHKIKIQNVDVSKALPASIDLEVGESIKFFHAIGWTGSDVTITFKYNPAARGRTVSPLKHVKKPLTLPLTTEAEVGFLTAIHPGSGEIFVNFKTTTNPPHTSSKSIPFKVVAAPRSGVNGQALHHTIYGNPPAGYRNEKPHPLPGAVIVVKNAKGVEVGRATADKDGNFKIALRPGKYKLESKVGRDWELKEDITIKRNQWLKLKAHYRYIGPPRPSAPPIRK